MTKRESNVPLFVASPIIYKKTVFANIVDDNSIRTSGPDGRDFPFGDVILRVLEAIKHVKYFTCDVALNTS